RPGDTWFISGADRVPVHAVHLLVEELIAQVGPRLMERLELLAREVDVELGGDGNRPRLAPLERDGVDAAAIEIQDLLAVGRGRRRALATRGRRQLARDRRAA